MEGRKDDGSTPQLIATACVILTVTLLTPGEDENPPKTGKDEKLNYYKMVS